MTFKCYCHCGEMIASFIVSPRMAAWVIGSHSIVSENSACACGHYSNFLVTFKRRLGGLHHSLTQRKVSPLKEGDGVIMFFHPALPFVLAASCVTKFLA